jgi:hypothetical protein
LRKVTDAVLGAVLNSVDLKAKSYYYYYQYQSEVAAGAGTPAGPKAVAAARKA